MSKLFNIGQKDRFTSKEDQKIIMLSDIKSAADIYLYSDTFNSEYVKMPNTDSVAYWQAPGKNYSYDDICTVNITTSLSVLHNILSSTKLFPKYIPNPPLAVSLLLAKPLITNVY